MTGADKREDSGLALNREGATSYTLKMTMRDIVISIEVYGVQLTATSPASHAQGGGVGSISRTTHSFLLTLDLGGLHHSWYTGWARTVQSSGPITMSLSPHCVHEKASSLNLGYHQ